MTHDERPPLFASIQCRTVVLVLHKKNDDRLHFITTVPGTYCSTIAPRTNTRTAVELYSNRVPWSRILYS